MGRRKGREAGRVREWEKCVVSSDGSVQLEWVKVEWVVMGDEDGGVNTLGGVVERGCERRRVCKRGSG